MTITLMAPANLPSHNPTLSFWQASPSKFLLHHRTTPYLPLSATVVIIGSGISGAFAARRLADKGLRDVVMLDAREACSGATGRNGGHCQPVFHGKPINVAEFERKNFDAVSSLIINDHIPCEWTEVPAACRAFFSQEIFDQAKAEVAALKQDSSELGHLVEIVSGRSRLADLKVSRAVGAIVQAKAAKLSPYKLITKLLESLIKQSLLNLQTETPVNSLSSCDGKWSVNTDRGSIQAPRVLLATNAYTSYLLPQFEKLIVPVQGEMSALSPPANVAQWPLRHTYGFMGEYGRGLVQNEYLVQRPHKLGGQLMYGGARALARHGGIHNDRDDSTDPAAAKHLRTMLGSYLDISDSDEVATCNEDATFHSRSSFYAEGEWTGIMGFSRDEFPWVGSIPDMDGVWLCGGYTGHGMPNAPLSAFHVADSIAASLNGEDWRLVEQLAVQSNSIPHQYLITKERIRLAESLGEVQPGSGHDPTTHAQSKEPSKVCATI